MLLDEITSALDPEVVGEVLNVIRSLNKEHNLRYLIKQGFKFVIRTNKDITDLWVYDPKISDELIKPSQKEVEDARELLNA